MKPSKKRFSRSDIEASPESAWIVDVAIIRTANGPLHCALVQDLKPSECWVGRRHLRLIRR